jgi:hypothetical protein
MFFVSTGGVVIAGYDLFVLYKYYRAFMKGMTSLLLMRATPTVCSSRPHVLQPKTRRHHATEFRVCPAKKVTEDTNWLALAKG